MSFSQAQSGLLSLLQNASPEQQDQILQQFGGAQNFAEQLRQQGVIGPGTSPFPQPGQPPAASQGSTAASQLQGVGDPTSTGNLQSFGQGAQPTPAPQSQPPTPPTPPELQTGQEQFRQQLNQIPLTGEIEQQEQQEQQEQTPGVQLPQIDVTAEPQVQAGGAPQVQAPAIGQQEQEQEQGVQLPALPLGQEEQAQARGQGQPQGQQPQEILPDGFRLRSALGTAGQTLLEADPQNPGEAILAAGTGAAQGLNQAEITERSIEDQLLQQQFERVEAAQQRRRLNLQDRRLNQRARQNREVEDETTERIEELLTQDLKGIGGTPEITPEKQEVLSQALVLAEKKLKKDSGLGTATAAQEALQEASEQTGFDLNQDVEIRLTEDAAKRRRNENDRIARVLPRLRETVNAAFGSVGVENAFSRLINRTAGQFVNEFVSDPATFSQEAEVSSTQLRLLNNALRDAFRQPGTEGQSLRSREFESLEEVLFQPNDFSQNPASVAEKSQKIFSELARRLEINKANLGGERAPGSVPSAGLLGKVTEERLNELGVKQGDLYSVRNPRTQETLIKERRN